MQKILIQAILRGRADAVRVSPAALRSRPPMVNARRASLPSSWRERTSGDRFGQKRPIRYPDGATRG
ncbi:hypothetical protein AKJ09_04571 [Labilithrix luteola]|uniref:Uncharacterized protein n=1 Tax=Labilithrix luteola TaxID=1391654 RepID=A0A0K1PWL4_9BACT|nr:hypothetical protein AKJ09_04571 [Labilithrix luteola]